MGNTVGVVIPVHNKRSYLGRAVASVLAQSHRDFALTVVDDGSTDGSAECLEEISDSRLKVLRTACRGPGAARNLGIRVTSADWIGLLDADDEWKPAFLERTVDVIRSSPRIVAAFVDIELRGVPRGRRPRLGGTIEDYHAARLRSHIAMTSSSVVLRKSTFLAIGGFREDYRYGEDTEAWFRLSCAGPSYYLPDALAVIDAGDPASTTRSAHAAERAAGLQMLLDSYEAYRASGRIPPALSRGCRRFMEHQRGRQALHLFAAGRRAEALRALWAGVPLGSHTWREYLGCAALLIRGRG